MSSERCVVLFTKPAVAGRVKTRLIGALSAEQAAALHAAFLADLCEEMERGDFELVVAWALEEGEEIPRRLLPAAAEGLRQSGADLGERLYRALAELGQRFRWVAAIGSDHPNLTAARVTEGFRRLEAGEEVVFGPAQDGGYYLVGVRSDSLSPRLFEGIPWSTAEVLERSLERCRELGLEVGLLPAGRDVDTPEDLEELAESLQRDETRVARCGRTRRLLRDWGRLVAG